MCQPSSRRARMRNASTNAVHARHASARRDAPRRLTLPDSPVQTRWHGQPCRGSRAGPPVAVLRTCRMRGLRSRAHCPPPRTVAHATHPTREPSVSDALAHVAWCTITCNNLRLTLRIDSTSRRLAAIARPASRFHCASHLWYRPAFEHLPTAFKPNRVGPAHTPATLQP